MIIDMHVHTTAGSADSLLSVTAMIEAARDAKVEGVVVAEHVRQWSPQFAREVAACADVRIFPAAEWSCEFGHVLVLGVDHETRYTGPLHTMRRVVEDQGGLMILAHPFRYFPGQMNLLFNRWPGASGLDSGKLAQHPAFALVDEIEALNNGCTDSENARARSVVCALGKTGVGGSDAHAADEVGRCVTEFEQPVEDVDDLIGQLRRGRFRAVRRSEPWTCA